MGKQFDYPLFAFANDKRHHVVCRDKTAFDDDDERKSAFFHIHLRKGEPGKFRFQGFKQFDEFIVHHPRDCRVSVEDKGVLLCLEFGK